MDLSNIDSWPKKKPVTSSEYSDAYNKFALEEEKLKEAEFWHEAIKASKQVTGEAPAESKPYSVPEAHITEEMLMQSNGIPEHIARSELKGDLSNLTKWNGNVLGVGVNFRNNRPVAVEALKRVVTDEQEFKDIMTGKKDITQDQAVEMSNLVYAQKRDHTNKLFKEYGVDIQQLPSSIKDIVDNLTYSGAMKAGGIGFELLKRKNYDGFIQYVSSNHKLKSRLVDGGLLNSQDSSFIADTYTARISSIIANDKISDKAKEKRIEQLLNKAAEEIAPIEGAKIDRVINNFLSN